MIKKHSHPLTLVQLFCLSLITHDISVTNKKNTRFVTGPHSIAVVLAIIAIVTTTAMAAPARRQPKTITQPDGSTITVVLHGDERHHWHTNLQGDLLELDEMGFFRLATATQNEAWLIKTKRAAMRADSIAKLPHFSYIPTSGIVHGLLILVEFQDIKFTTIENPLQHYTDMMMKPGFDYAISPTSKYKHIGSVHEYFYENSNGIMDLQMDVVGPVTMPEKASFYASSSDHEAWKMFVEACQQLDDSIDFSLYDNDGDGKVDFLCSFYAGPGANTAGVSSTAAIWPHQGTIAEASGGQIFYFDGMQIDSYACTNEEFFGKPDGMGTFCHEFSHLFGLPHLHNYFACTPMDYDLMDSGAYLLNGYCPAPYSSYERYELGWLNPVELTETGNYTLPALTSRNEAYIVPVTPDLEDPRTGEYYLFENRQKNRWDAQLPGHGMLIWHIDYVQSKWESNQPNSWALHQCIDLVEADGIKSDSLGYFQDASAAFPGSAGNTDFTSTTSPAFLGWEYPGHNVADLTVQLNKSITQITEKNGIVSFHFTNDTENTELNPESILVEYITLSRTDLQLTIGDTYQITATVLPSDATETSLTWTSSNESVALVSSSGKVVATGYGSTAITATAIDGSGISATCTVTVSPILVNSITLSATELFLKIGDTHTLIASVLPNNAADKSITWTSSNESVALVSSSGKVVATGYGSTAIIATATDGSGISASCIVSVSQVMVQQIQFSTDYLELIAGENATIQANIIPTDALVKTLRWSSSNEDVAMVSSTGKVVAIAPGYAIITASATDGSGVTATAIVAVKTDESCISKVVMPSFRLIKHSLELTLSGLDDGVEVYLYNLSGTLLGHGTTKTGACSFTLPASVPTGLYILSIDGHLFKVNI